MFNEHEKKEQGTHKVNLCEFKMGIGMLKVKIMK